MNKKNNTIDNKNRITLSMVTGIFGLPLALSIIPNISNPSGLESLGGFMITFICIGGLGLFGYFIGLILDIKTHIEGGNEK